MNTPLPLAIEPLYRLVHQHFVVRQQPGMVQALETELPETLLRRCIAAESSVALLLPILTELLAPLPADQNVALAEHLALWLRTLDGLLANDTPCDAVAPRITTQVQRQHMMPAQMASLLVQATLVVVLSALADEAKWIIVSTPRTPRGGVQITIEADAAGLDAGINDGLRDQIAECLCGVGGELLLQTTDRKTWLTQIWVPGARTARGKGKHDATA